MCCCIPGLCFNWKISHSDCAKESPGQIRGKPKHMLGKSQLLKYLIVLRDGKMDVYHNVMDDIHIDMNILKNPNYFQEIFSNSKTKLFYKNVTSGQKLHLLSAGRPDFQLCLFYNFNVKKFKISLE